MRLFLLAAMAVLVFNFSMSPAEATRSRQSYGAQQEWWNQTSSTAQTTSWGTRDTAPSRRGAGTKRQRFQEAASRYERDTSMGGGGYSAGPRPGKWCGWYMRTLRGGGPELNVAWNWSRWGRAASGPQVGAVVVWRHHVGEIVGQASNGQWIVRSGNDGGAVRVRARSVSGAVFRMG